MAALKAHVALFDKKGVLHTFEPGDEVPAWAAKKITNPKAWGGDPPAVEQPDEGDKAAEIAALKAEVARLQATATPGGVEADRGQGTNAGQGSGSTEPPPPLAGPGSGRDLWAAYAAQFPDKVEVVEDDKRDDIVAKLRNASIPVE